MAFKDVVRDLGNHVKVGPNTKGTGTRGNPLPDIGKTLTAPATSNPSKGGLKTVGRNISPLDDLKPRQTAKGNKVSPPNNSPSSAKPARSNRP